MKITKERILEIIKEEISDLTEKDDSSLSTKTMSNTQRRKDVLDRLKSADAEFDSLEQSFVNQFEEFLTNLASQPGVSLGNHKAILQRIMKVLQDKISQDETPKEV